MGSKDTSLIISCFHKDQSINMGIMKQIMGKCVE